MDGEIVNRVANSALVTFNLEEHYPSGKRISVDIAQWLFEGLVVREQAFRQAVKELDCSEFQDAYVALNCSTDAIVPVWAYMLLSLRISETAKQVVFGDLEDLENTLFAQFIETLDMEAYQNKPVIIKGCSNKPIPTNAYLLLAQKLKTVAKSVMYGEACSSVPLYKKKQ